MCKMISWFIILLSKPPCKTSLFFLGILFGYLVRRNRMELILSTIDTITVLELIWVFVHEDGKNWNLDSSLYTSQLMWSVIFLVQWIVTPVHNWLSAWLNIFVLPLFSTLEEFVSSRYMMLDPYLIYVE